MGQLAPSITRYPITIVSPLHPGHAYPVFAISRKCQKTLNSLLAAKASIPTPPRSCQRSSGKALHSRSSRLYTNGNAISAEHRPFKIIKRLSRTYKTTNRSSILRSRLEVTPQSSQRNPPQVTR